MRDESAITYDTLEPSMTNNLFSSYHFVDKHIAVMRHLV